MSKKIIGITVGSPLPKPDFKQTDPSKGDYIKNKPKFATNDEIIEMLIQEDMFPIVVDSDGNIMADENENILLW
jgi:hypothetical protein